MRSLGSRAARSRRRYSLMLSYAGRRWRGWSAILVTNLLGTAAGLLAPLPLKVLVDSVLGSHGTPSVMRWLPGAETTHGLLAWVVAFEILVFVFASAVELASTFLWTVVGQGMVFELTQDMFARVQRRSLREHMRHPVGDTIERVAEDSWSVHTVIEELILTPLHSVVTIVSVAVVMLSLNAGLTAVSFAVAPLMALAPLLLGRRIRSVAEEQRQVQGRIHSHIQQTLAGIPVVQAFGQEMRTHWLFEQLARRVIRLQARRTLLGGLGTLGSGLATTIGTGVVLLIGAHAVLHGHLTTGGLLVFVSYVGLVQGQMGGLTATYSTLQGVRPSIDRVVEVLDAEADVEDRGDAVALERVSGAIVIDRVTFGYEFGRPVLREVSLSARPGQTIAIVGPTGAGKSTLAGLLPRFFDPDQGRVLLDGRDLRELPLRQVRGSVSLVLQESFLFPITIAENIAYGRPGASRQEIIDAARTANADQFITRLPDGYDTTVGERGATLSGGERQRIAIARALLKDAPILILDEPTSALDAETERLLLQALERLMAGRTTMIIAHRLSTIRQADEIVVLRDGQIIERGQHQELLQRGGHYARMHDIQHGAAASGREVDR